MPTKPSRAPEPVPVQSSGGIGFAFGLIVGALIGAAAATLLAPQPGELTREQLRRQAQRLRHNVTGREP